MGKGVIDSRDPKFLGTVGLQSNDYKMAGFEDADLVIAIGYDLVEHAPKHWNPGRDKKIVVVDSVPAEIDANLDRKSTRLNSSHANISYAVFCLKKKTSKITLRLDQDETI